MFQAASAFALAEVLIVCNVSCRLSRFDGSFFMGWACQTKTRARWHSMWVFCVVYRMAAAYKVLCRERLVQLSESRPNTQMSMQGVALLVKPSCFERSSIQFMHRNRRQFSCFEVDLISGRQSILLDEY